MGSLAFEKLKKELFVAYEAQLTALVEGPPPTEDNDGEAGEAGQRPSATTAGNDDDDDELVRLLPEHLRLSYPRQHLLCQRASRVAGRRLPLKTAQQADAAAEQGAGEEETTNAEGKPLDDEENEVFVAESQPDWLRHRMLRVQEESIQRLREDVLLARQRKAAVEGNVTADGGGEEGSTTEAEVTELSEQDVYAIIAKGGISGGAFTQQRMALLKQMERETQKRRIEQMAAESDV